MQLPQPLRSGRLIRRYKRFLADVQLDNGPIVTVHCPNPGRMTGVQDPGLRVWLSRSANPKRKLPCTMELVEADGALVGINTGYPNRIVAEAVKAGMVPELAAWPTIRTEVACSAGTRIDMRLEAPKGPPCWVEIKNVQMRRMAGPNPGAAEFPDAVTARGARHLKVLSDRIAAGDRAAIFFVVQRTDCDRFAVAGDIDPTYRRALEQALAAGVEAICYDCHMSTTDIKLRRRLELDLEFVKS